VGEWFRFEQGFSQVQLKHAIAYLKVSNYSCENFLAFGFDGGALKRVIFLAIALSAAIVVGCGPANQLLVPARITSPPGAPFPSGQFGVVVAVFDFSYELPQEPGVIGRDSDRVRQIVWEGNPGHLLADLIVSSLLEKGVPAVRLKAGVTVTPENSLILVNGNVRQFEVNISRKSVVNAHIEAAIEMTLFVSGRDTTIPWETLVSSDAVVGGLIPMSGDVRKALSSAANIAADEAVRRLREKNETISIR
jgi:hypothetical protein